MYSRLLYAKKIIQPCLIRPISMPESASFTTPFCHSNSIARREQPINVNLSRLGNSCFGARGVSVSVRVRWEGGGGGAGYVNN